MKKENTSIRLKQLMEKRNLRQVDILNLTKPYCEKYKVKMNKSDISQYVSGKNEPSQDKLVVLGMALNVRESWLMGYDVPMERNDLSQLKNDLIAIEHDMDTMHERVSYYTNFRKVLNILGYSLTMRWNTSENGESIDLLENENFQIEVPHSVIKEQMNSSKAFIEFQLMELFKKYDAKPRNKTTTISEFPAQYLAAAHERTDIEVTEEMREHDDAIMMDDSEWE